MIKPIKSTLPRPINDDEQILLFSNFIEEEALEIRKDKSIRGEKRGDPLVLVLLASVIQRRSLTKKHIITQTT